MLSPSTPCLRLPLGLKAPIMTPHGVISFFPFWCITHETPDEVTHFWILSNSHAADMTGDYWLSNRMSIALLQTGMYH